MWRLWNMLLRHSKRWQFGLVLLGAWTIWHLSRPSVSWDINCPSRPYRSTILKHVSQLQHDIPYFTIIINFFSVDFVCVPFLHWESQICQVDEDEMSIWLYPHFVTSCDKQSVLHILLLSFFCCNLCIFIVQSGRLNYSFPTLNTTKMSRGWGWPD